MAARAPCRAQVRPSPADSVTDRTCTRPLWNGMSMRVNIDSREAVHVARQPILDRSDRVIGYELLYCGDAPASGRLTSDEVAATRVITDALLAIGLDTLTSGLPAFLGVTQR